MLKIKKIFTIAFFYSTILVSDQASPTPFKVTQPNGDSLKIHIRGNFLQSWYEFNGSTIIKNYDNWWVYASGSNSNGLIASQYKVGIDMNPFQTANIRPPRIDFIDNSPVPNLSQTRSDTFHIPWLLVDFPDASFTYDREQIGLVLNQKGYSHPNYDNTGSFHDFYKEISHGQFLAKSNISNWITAQRGHDYYGHENGYDRVRELIRNAVDEIEESGFDWSSYDNDGDGYVDALNIIHQGAGAEEGDESNIWSHKWSLGNLSVTYDGVTISSYTINPEIQNGEIVAIGVLAHEFGHALGLPDLYDTDYSSTGSGKLSLMASGSWGTVGNTPWYPSTMIGWCKAQLGWAEIDEIEDPNSSISLTQTYSNNRIVRVNHPEVSEEYWLIENRQKVGSDTLMPSAGLAIWHINDDFANGWSPNTNEPYYGVGLEQADGLFTLENGGPSDGSDLYPDGMNNREFSHSSSPNTTSLFGIPSLVRIDNISDPQEIMTFDVEYNEIILANAAILDGIGTAYNNGSIKISLENQMQLSELEFELGFSPSFVEIIGVIPTERVSYDSVIINENYIKLVNPVIETGEGELLELQLFNHIGIGMNINVQFNTAVAYTIQNEEVGIMFAEDANYTINSIEQHYEIQTNGGAIGGGASYQVSSVNTVPISMGVIKFESFPNIITPSDEPFQDENENGIYDIGEPFTDWNQDQQWTPMVESLLPSDWDLDVNFDGDVLSVGFVNWNESTPIGLNSLFTVNCSVNEEAQLNDEVLIMSNVIIQVDKWGNAGIPFVNGSGTIVIDEILSNDITGIAPINFHLNNIYPNPFNNSTIISFELDKKNIENLKISIFDLKGRVVKSYRNNYFKVGKNLLTWNAQNLGNGIYFLELKTKNKRVIRKLTLLK